MPVFPEPIESKHRLSEGATQYDPESTAPQFQALSPEERERLRDEVVEACQPVAQNWPMKTFAYRNPLRGWEHLPFDNAIREAKHLLARISQMCCLTLACNLRQPFENKGIDAFHAELTGEPNG